MRKLIVNITLADLVVIRRILADHSNTQKAVIKAIDDFLAMPIVMCVELDESDLASWKSLSSGGSESELKGEAAPYSADDATEYDHP